MSAKSHALSRGVANSLPRNSLAGQNLVLSWQAVLKQMQASANLHPIFVETGGERFSKPPLNCS